MAEGHRPACSPWRAQPAQEIARPRLKLCRALRERHYNTAGELLGTALFTAISRRAWMRILIRSMSCCAASPPSANSRRAPLTTSPPLENVLSSKIVAAAFSARGIERVRMVDSRECIVTDAQLHAAPFPCSTKPMNSLQKHGAAVARSGPRAGHGRLHRREQGGRHHHASAAAGRISPRRSSAPA